MLRICSVPRFVMIAGKTIPLVVILLSGILQWRRDSYLPHFSKASENVYSDYLDVVLQDSLDRVRRDADCDDRLNATDKVTASNIYPSSVELTWTPVEGSLWYAVRVKSPLSTCIRGQNDEITENHVTLRDLDAETAYVVEVVTHHVNGCSNPTEVRFSTTYGTWKCEGSSDVPGKVENLMVLEPNITATTALVLWDPVPKALTYKVSINPPNFLFFGLGDTSEERTTISGLTPGSKFTVSVFAQNGNRKGPTATTTFISRLEVPEDFQIVNVTDRHLKVIWKQSKQVARFTIILNELTAEGSFEVERTETSGTFKYFVNLKSATRYQVELQAFNDISTSVKKKITLYSKLPKTGRIQISNITDISVFAEWDRVEGAIAYMVILRNYPDYQIVKKERVTGTSYLLDELKDASQYELEIIAVNEKTTSLPGTQTVYTRLVKMQHLNIDVEYVQDTSLVVRWEKVGGALWYEVYLKPNTSGMTGAGVVKTEYTRIKNLVPGTKYTITAVAKNHKVFDTVSLPAVVAQFTRLSRPLNLSAEYQGVTNNSMKITWLPVPHARSYLLLVYDCSGQDRTIGKVERRKKVEAVILPREYQTFAKYWNYAFPKEKSLDLQCEKAYDSAEHAIEEGVKKLPSRISGQGNLSSPEAILTNMRPGVRYEILVVSGSSKIQSYPSVILRYTKLTSPDAFHIVSGKIGSGSINLEWEEIAKSQYCKLDTYYTPIVEGVSQRKRQSIKMKHVKTQEVRSTSIRAYPLQPSTNYTFKLTAKNSDTESFPVYVTSFTRLASPQTLNLVLENLTTDTIYLQWTQVEGAVSYRVRALASNERIKKPEPFYRNVSSPEILLRHLMANTLYQITIIAQNRYTRSRPVSTNTFTKLPTPENFTVTEVTDSAIRLTWSPVEGNDQYSLAAVRYPMEPETLGRYKTKDNEYHFTYLAPNTLYVLYMRATTQDTASDVVKLFQYTKLPKPQRLSFVEVGATKMRLSWQPVEDVEVYNLLIIPLFNESHPGSADQLNATLFTDVIQVGRAGRLVRSVDEGKSRPKRVRRSGSESSESATEIKFIEYVGLKRKSTGSGRLVKVESGKSFADIRNVYEINANSTNVLLKLLEPGVKYKVVVRAVNSNTSSDPVFQQRFTKLRQPHLIEAREVKNDRFLVRWAQGITKATYYQVQIFPENKNWLPSLTQSGTGNTTSSEIQVLGLEANTNYTIAVTAWNGHVSSKRTLTWKITKLSPTENLRVVQSSVKHDRFHLQWNKVKYAKKYMVIISPPTADSRSSFEVPFEENKFTVNHLKDGTLYSITVSAVNTRTDGVPSTIQTWTKLLTPRNVIIIEETVNSSSISVSWEKVRNADKYQLRLSNSSGTTVKSVVAARSPYTFTGLKSGQRYVVELVANNTKHRTYSDPVRVESFTKLETPKNFRVAEDDLTDTAMQVAWDPVPLASEYLLTVGIQVRDDDDYRSRRSASATTVFNYDSSWTQLSFFPSSPSYVFWHLDKKHFRIPGTSVSVKDLQPASYYLVQLKAINDDTESALIEFYEFTKLPHPRNVTLLNGYYMDTEAELDWKRVKQADFYELKIYKYQESNTTVKSDGDEYEETQNLDYQEETGAEKTNVTDAYDQTSRTKFPYYTKIGLSPSTRYKADIKAINNDTGSDSASLIFETKSSCTDDYHHFPNTHLSQTLPQRTISNSSAEDCLRECCLERNFVCLSVSLHRSTSACLLFSEDRLSAPPLAISRIYDHYERKFWKEVSGFQIRSITHNNVAVMNETVELTLTFVYLGKMGCVSWNFGDGGVTYHSILDTDCSHLCNNSNVPNCTVIRTDPNSNENQIRTSHVYDMETVFKVRVNVTDDKSYEMSTLNLAINDRGCVYPSITIEEEGKILLDPKEIFRSKKLLMSTTPNIVCNSFPGVQFLWGAVRYDEDMKTPIASFRLEALGSEIMVPALTFPLGLYRVSVNIKLLDERQKLEDTDAVYIMVEASPLVARIKGGSMRTVGSNRVVTWDASSVSYDPDVVASDPERTNLNFKWFCKNYTDTRFRPLESGSCFPDLSQLTFHGPGMFSLDTSLMHLYVDYAFQVAVSKGDRTNKFRQQIIVKEGDPPDFHIKCVDNCNAKMNPTKALALQALCSNCDSRRDPRYKWRLYEVTTEDSTAPTAAPTPAATEGYEETSPGKSSPANEIFKEVTDWEGNTTTGSNSPIVVMKKNALIAGRKYVLRINISMEGLDDRVYGFSDFEFLTNLPPYGGVCATAASIGNCYSFVSFPESSLPSAVNYTKILQNTTSEKCQEYCCLTRNFMCLSVTFNTETFQCLLFEHNKESAKQDLIDDYQATHYQRLFYKGGAVVDEIVFECRDWKDEGDLKSYPEEGERMPKTTLNYKFTTIPQSNSTKGLLLYFGSVQKTPGISMALGDAMHDYGVTVIAQICDIYGECALSNVIYLQIVPPSSPNMGSTLTGLTNGNASKLNILSNTGNSKAAAQLVQSISSIINVNEEDENIVLLGNMTQNWTSTIAWTTTGTPTTYAPFTTAATFLNASRNGTLIAKDAKKNLRSDVVQALSAATSGMTSIDNLQQMTSAMSAITQKTDEVNEEAQKQASDTVKRMAGSLSDFSEETNKEDVTSAASDIVGSLGSVTKASETDMGDLRSQMMQKKEIDYAILDERDLSPDEYEYYNKKKLKEEKKRVRRSAAGSQDVVGNAVAAMASTAQALLGKQMEGEPPVDVSSKHLEMKVEKTPPSELGNRSLATSSGTSIKLPDAATLLGKNATNLTEPIDMQVTAFSENPFGFGEDAAFIDSPVTMLTIGSAAGAEMGNNDTDSSSGGVSISIPSKFNAERDMVTIWKDINDTGLSISKFEVQSTSNAILIMVEPEDERAEFEVYISHSKKPTEEDFDFKFQLPYNILEIDSTEEAYKIFISEDDVVDTGIYYIGIRDKLNVTQALGSSRGRVRRRRSVGVVNSTTYHMLIATPGCRRFDQEKKVWTGDGCKVDERSTPDLTECLCTKLSPTAIFSAEFFVPPNTINFATVWAKIDIADNPAVFATVISLVILYGIMLVWTHYMDKRDVKKWSLKATVDNRKDDKYLYQVTVFTGHGRSAATQSKVSCIIFGEKGKSRVRRLMIAKEPAPFTRSSVVHFLLREPKDLGSLTHVHIWHDNSGKSESRSWFLDQVVVQNVSSGKRYFFICDQWLAVDHDDGKVDRILPVATAENMSAFHRLFVSTTTQKFTEDHLWISLFYRPTKSNFTRKQRLSCCMCLLFMTMIANAMFFESGGSSSKSGTTALQVGPFKISPLQIWTSFCSTLLVVPVTTLIMTLFKKAKTKEQERNDKEEKQAIQKAVQKFNKRNKHHKQAASLPNPSDLRGCDAVYTINVDGTINARPNIAGSSERNNAAKWPHWCVYVAWTLTWIAILVSGFFAILYSFEWGKDKANRWLGNMMLSFWQSVLVVQPIKVIVFAMFIAAIVKKPDQQALDSVDPQEIKDADKKFVNLCSENLEAELQEKELQDLAPPKPPSKRKLRKARRLRAKEKQMSMIIWEVITYFMYIMVLLFLCHGNRDSKGQLINEQLKKTYVESTYGLKSATTVPHFWRFIDKVLLPNIYSGHWYNGERKSWRERNFLSDEQSYRVGPARLRQLRIKERLCPVVGTKQRVCRSQFFFHEEETGNYDGSWKKVSNMTLTPQEDEADMNDPIIAAWKHQNWIELKGIPFVGGIATYPGGGYAAELGVNFESGKMISKSLFNNSWVDQQTRAVFSEFTVYNPNVNLFSCVQLLVEFPPMGAAVSYTNIATFRLYQYIGAYGTVMIFAQIIFVLHLLHFTYHILRQMFRERLQYFKKAWNVFDFVIMFVDWSITGLYASRLVLTSITMNAFHQNKKKYVNFQQVMTADSMVATALAISAFFGIVRFLKLLRFNRKTGMLSSVITNSAKQWPGFIALAAVFFIAFIHIGYLIFCAYLKDFRTLFSTTETMFSTMMGRPIYEDLRDAYRIFGPAYYFFFCFTAAFIVINVLIAIVNESYGITLETVTKSKNDFEILDFMFKRFRKWTGLAYLQPVKEKKIRPSPLSADQVPLPPLPYKCDFAYGKTIVDMQKNLDQYLYNLESKYSKYLTLEEVRDEVIGEMKKIPQHNHSVQRDVLRRRHQIRNTHQRNDQSMTMNVGTNSKSCNAAVSQFGEQTTFKQSESIDYSKTTSSDKSSDC